jgi:hypothetical protein
MHGLGSSDGREEEFLMSQDAEPLDYADWPPDLPARHEQALKLLGRHMVGVYDGSVATAKRIILEGSRPYVFAEEERAALAWLDTLPEEARQRACSLVNYQLGLMLFSFLCTMDGMKGHVFHAGVWERIRPVIEIYPRDAEGKPERPREPLETIKLNPQRQSGSDLHDYWPEWLEQYSRWHADRSSEE